MERPRSASRLPFQRVAVLGSPGSGKSTLSEGWGRITGLPVLHLDLLVFKPGWIFATMEEIAPVLDARVQEDGWIIEGYTEEAQRRRILAAAERIVLLETPFEICIERAVQRMEEQKKAPNRFTQEDCSYEDIMDKHLEFIAHYQETLHPGILRMIDEEFSATPRVVLDGRLSVEALCAIVKSLR